MRIGLPGRSPRSFVGYPLNDVCTPEQRLDRKLYGAAGGGTAYDMKYRSDIDGLRGIAILCVLLYHFDVPQLPGGFVGVDIFFVISGYLITGIIATEIRSGKFSLWKFYERRVRRILPAFFVTLGLSALASFLLLSPRHFLSFGESLLAATYSFSNIYFWYQVGYFDAEAIFKPLLHTWSLGVEEQFYLFWPFLMILFFRSQKPVLAVAAIAIASLISSYLFLERTATAFYLVPFRVFEFCIGAMVLWLPPSRQHTQSLRVFLAAAGFAAIGYSAAAYSAATRFPFHEALMPCIGAAALIYAQRSGVAQLLTLSPLVFIGKISYSLYLVHWPLVILYKYWKFAPVTPWELGLLLLICFGISFVMYRYVERPFRLGADCFIGGRQLLVILAVSFVVLSAFGLLAAKQKLEKFRPTPGISESLKQLINLPQCVENVGLCNEVQVGHDIALIGDSHANATTFYGPFAVNGRMAIKAYEGLPACFPIYNNALPCEEAMNQRIDEIIGSGVKAVILAANWNVNTHQYKEARLLDKIEETIAMFQQAHIQVYVWGSMPFHARDPASCYERPFNRDCPSRMRPENYEDQKRFNSVLRDLVLRNHARYFDMFDAMCDEFGCDVGIEKLSLYGDRYHIYPRHLMGYLMAKRKMGKAISLDDLFVGVEAR